MLPAFRFILGAALATLLLVLTVFGLAATVRLAQETKVSPLETARALAYATPAGWGELHSAEDKHLSDGAHEADGAEVGQLRGGEWLIPAELAKPGASPQERDKSISPQKDTILSPLPGERLEASSTPAALERQQEVIADTGSTVEIRAPAPAQESPSPPADLPESAMTAASDQSATAERSSASVEPQGTGGPRPEMEALTEQSERASDIPVLSSLPSDRSENGLEQRGPPGNAADDFTLAGSKPADPVATAKHVKPRAAPVSKAAQKPKPPAHAAKLKKPAPKRNAALPTNPPFTAATVPAPAPRSSNNQGWSLSGEPLTPLPSQSQSKSHSCGLGSTACPRVSVGSQATRSGSQMPRPAPSGSHP
jgi:hypothetical protein